MNSFTASTHGRRNGLLEFAIVLKPKNNKKNENPGNVPLFFFHFSTTMLLQLGVCDL